MHIDARILDDDPQQGRDHRARAEPARERPATGSPGTPTEPTIAGGPEPVTRAEHQPPREQSERAAARERELHAEQRAAERRQEALREMARRLRLPTDTELDIEVDRDTQEVRFLVRDRDTGELVRAIPPEETASLADTLREFRGAFVDRRL